jgi:hypothetical protein
MIGVRPQNVVTLPDDSAHFRQQAPLVQGVPHQLLLAPGVDALALPVQTDRNLNPPEKAVALPGAAAAVDRDLERLLLRGRLLWGGIGVGHRERELERGGEAGILLILRN